MCTQITIQETPELEYSYAFSVEENPSNFTNSPKEQAAVRKKLWNPRRRVLSVDFIDEPAYLDKIISNAKIWENFMGIQFRFGTYPPDILVTFTPGGSWSNVGTDSGWQAGRGIPSMNFGWFSQGSDDVEFRRTVLHEFGHALGLIHEHLHPDIRMPWHRAAVYQYYANLGWSADMVDRNIFAVYDLNQLNSTTYDSKSIMHYPIDSRLLLDPSYAVGWNTEISEGDRQFISGLYPMNASQL